jgi:hypothetical protein
MSALHLAIRAYMQVNLVVLLSGAHAVLSLIATISYAQLHIQKKKKRKAKKRKEKQSKEKKRKEKGRKEGRKMTDIKT